MSPLGGVVVEACRRHPVWAMVALGFLLRAMAALSGFGWFAADDYFQVVEPAWRWLEEPELPYPSSIRSPLYAWVFHRLLQLAGLFTSDPRWLLRLAYLALGAISLAVIPGVHALASRHSPPAAALTAALLAAAYALMPRIASRALIEVGAMLPLVWSLLFFDASVRGPPRARFLNAFVGGLLFALAAMIRFQVGVIVVAVVGWMVWHALRQPDRQRDWVPLAGLASAGAVGASAQIGVDAIAERGPFATLLAYVEFNLSGSSQYGVSAWYTYLLQLLLLTVPPVALWLAKPLWRACREHALVSLSLLSFVLAHSLVPHKEDRFLFPILPLLFVLLGAALAELRRGDLWARRAFTFFWGVNVLALPVALFSDAQRSVTVPLLKIGQTGESVHLAAIKVGRVPHLYLGHGHQVSRYSSLEELGAAIQGGGHGPDFILVRPVPDEGSVAALAAAGLTCRPPRLFAGDWVDQALVALNERNQRRRPTALLDCR